MIGRRALIGLRQPAHIGFARHFRPLARLGRSRQKNLDIV
jgi:hypothetical protein